MSMSNYLEAAILNWLTGTAFPTAPTTLYVGLSTADPGEAGAGLAEPSGGAGYARQAVTLGAVTQGSDAATRTNTAEVTFGPATSNWGSITHFAVFDAVSGGNLLYSGTVTTPRTVNSGDEARFAASTLTISQQ